MPDTLSSCPFYGVRIVEFAPGELPSAAVLASTKGLECGLITHAPVPCIVQLAGDRPAWSECLRNPVNNGSFLDTGIPARPLPAAPRDVRESIAEFGAAFEALGHDETPETLRSAELRKADPAAVRALSEVKRGEG